MQLTAIDKWAVEVICMFHLDLTCPRLFKNLTGIPCSDFLFLWLSVRELPYRKIKKIIWKKDEELTKLRQFKVGVQYPRIFYVAHAAVSCVLPACTPDCEYDPNQWSVKEIWSWKMCVFLLRNHLEPGPGNAIWWLFSHLRFAPRYWGNCYIIYTC